MKLLKYFIYGLLTAGLLFTAACSSDDPLPDPDPPVTPVDPEEPKEPENPEVPDDGYVAPDYADNYTTIAGWNMRDQWNLANVHDPTVEKSGDYYYMYTTDASYGNEHERGGGHFPYRRSKDLVDWEFRGFAMDGPPAWVKDSLNNMRTRENLPMIEDIQYGYWAPVVRKYGNKYRMYYSIVINNYIKTGAPASSAFDGSWTERAFIGLMECEGDLGDNIWEDKGMVVCSVSDRPGKWQRSGTGDWDGYFYINAIDPSYIVTPEGEHWLVYGSWHAGIGAIQLEPASGKPYEFDSYQYNPEQVKRIATRNDSPRWQGSEAPEIIYNEETGYYYLFLAYDALDVPYNTRVCRSREITGPYLGIDGTNVTNGGTCYPILTHPYKFSGHNGWVGISHNCVFRDDEGNWYYSSQARLPHTYPGVNAPNANMMGFVNQIRWTSDGWPVVMPERYAAVPEGDPVKESDLIGLWEVITLEWDYGNQNTSSTFSLLANGTASGAFTGNWTYDPDLKRLYVGGHQLEVERGLDWEANPRVRTLIFSGLDGSNRRHSLWGKQK